jgi:hypothetical protein
MAQQARGSCFLALGTYYVSSHCVLCALQAHVNSKKYQQLVRDSGEAAPAPIIMVKQLKEDEGAAGCTVAAPPSGESSRPSRVFGVLHSSNQRMIWLLCALCLPGVLRILCGLVNPAVPVIPADGLV